MADATASDDNRGILATRIAPVGAALHAVDAARDEDAPDENAHAEGARNEAALDKLDDDVEPVTPRAYSEIVPAAFPDGSIPPSPSRNSRVVPRGTADQELEEAKEATEAAERGAPQPESVEETSADQVVEAAAQHAEPNALEQEAATPDRAPAEAAAAELSALPQTGAEQPEEEPHAPPPVVAQSHESGIAFSNAVSVGPAASVLDLNETLIGPDFGLDDEDEETTVDATAAISEEEHHALLRRIHSALGETAPIGTPLPTRTQPATPAWDRNRSFRQTMLMHLPQLSPPAPPAPPMVPPPAPQAADGETPGPAPASPAPPMGGEPAEPVMASPVRVVGPPTQPPPRRSRRAGSASQDLSSEPDHEAFVLTTPLSPGAKRLSLPGAESTGAESNGAGANAAVPNAAVSKAAVPNAAVPNAAESDAALSNAALSNADPSKPGLTTATPSNGAARNGAPPLNYGTLVGGRTSMPGVMLPPPPQPRDYEPASSPAAAASPASASAPDAAAAPYPPLPSADAPGAPAQRKTVPPGLASLSSLNLRAAALNALASSGHSHAPPPPRDSVVPPLRASMPPLRASIPPVVVTYPPGRSSTALRASLEASESLTRTRPPASRQAVERPSMLEELPTSDPFAGFVAPPPSVAQRWLIVVVVALAVVGLCSLAAIAFGFLGKTGW